MLFYVPRLAPFDLWDRDQRHGVKLYVRRVFIMDAAEQFLPAYLRFVRGIVDSGDLPLNVSREILQQSPEVAQIRAASAKRVLGLLERISPSTNRRNTDVLERVRPRPEGGHRGDRPNHDRLARLLSFRHDAEAAASRLCRSPTTSAA